MPDELGPEADNDGNITGCPLLRQTTWKLQNGQILLALEIAQTEQELQAMKGQAVQIFLTKIQAMELARMLTDAADAEYRQ